MKKYVSISFLMLTAFMAQSCLLGMEENSDSADHDNLQNVIDSKPRSALLGSGFVLLAAGVGAYTLAPKIPPALKRICGAVYYGSKHGLFYLWNGKSLEEDSQELQEALRENMKATSALSTQMAQLSAGIPATGIPLYPPAPTPDSSYGQHQKSLTDGKDQA